MRQRNKFHLFPTVVVEINLRHADDTCRVRGIYATDSIDQEEGTMWFERPDLIAIVKAKKVHTCEVCGHLIEPKRHPFTFKVIGGVYYVGISEWGCSPEWWGYDTKICLACASEAFKNVQVYRCDGEDSWDGGWLKKAPELKKESLALVEEIKKFEETTKE